MRTASLWIVGLLCVVLVAAPVRAEQPATDADPVAAIAAAIEAAERDVAWEAQIDVVVSRRHGDQHSEYRESWHAEFERSPTRYARHLWADVPREGAAPPQRVHQSATLIDGQLAEWSYRSDETPPAVIVSRPPSPRWSAEQSHLLLGRVLEGRLYSDPELHLAEWLRESQAADAASLKVQRRPTSPGSAVDVVELAGDGPRGAFRFVTTTDGRVLAGDVRKTPESLGYGGRISELDVFDLPSGQPGVPVESIWIRFTATGRAPDAESAELIETMTFADGGVVNTTVKIRRTAAPALRGTLGEKIIRQVPDDTPVAIDAQQPPQPARVFRGGKFVEQID